MIIRYLGKTKKIKVKKASIFGRISGLMFRPKTTENLLFEFRKKTRIKIHSFFVFFNFLAIWIDRKNKVIFWKIIGPFSPAFSPKKSFSKIIEVPLNKRNIGIINFFVGKKGLNISEA